VTIPDSALQGGLDDEHEAWEAVGGAAEEMENAVQNQALSLAF
jgi:hypothetical protein